MQGFPGSGKLPVNDAIFKHYDYVELTRYRASRHFARLPFRMDESGLLTLWTTRFLSLPSDNAVASNALAIRVVFPPVGVTPV